MLDDKRSATEWLRRIEMLNERRLAAGGSAGAIPVSQYEYLIHLAMDEAGDIVKAAI